MQRVKLGLNDESLDAILQMFYVEVDEKTQTHVTEA
jgi:hypothetical protein